MFKHFRNTKYLFKVYGFKPILLLVPIWRLFYHSLLWPCMLYDEIFFPKYRKVRLEKPIFIIGHPRSGTTFLHRFLCNHSDEISGLKLKNMILPSLTMQKFFGGIVEKNDHKTTGKLYEPEIHKTSAGSYETDDAAIFFRFFSGMFSWIYFNSWKKYKSINAMECELKSLMLKKKFIKHLKTLHKKNNLGKNRRMISKLFSIAIDPVILKDHFPDAKIIYMIRNPKDAIPSSISLVKSIQSKLFAFSKLEEKKQIEYYKNLYDSSRIFYKNASELTNSRKTEDILFIHYYDLKDSFENTLQLIMDYCDIKPDKKLIDAIEQQKEKQKTYSGLHKYSCTDFGFEEEAIIHDFSKFYKFNS